MTHCVQCGSSVTLHFVVLLYSSATASGYVAIYVPFLDHQYQVLSELANEFIYSRLPLEDFLILYHFILFLSQVFSVVKLILVLF